MKRLLKSIFVLALVLVQIMPVLTVNAKEVNSGSIGSNTKGKITITNAIEGETYKVYQILKLESYSKGKAYAYKATDAWADFVNSDAIKDVYLVVDAQGYVSWKDGADVVTFAEKAIKHAKDNQLTEDGKAENVSSEIVTFEDLELGYYLVDSSTGALCSLDTTDNEVEITEKNTIPSVKKTVSENGTYDSKNDVNIGDPVSFKTVITVGAGADNYILKDKMSDGLDFQSITKVELTGTGARTLAQGTDYKMVSTAGTEFDFIMDFEPALEENLTADNTIVVYYTAKVNENAVIGGNGNENETHLTYGDQNTVSNTSITNTYVFKFDLVKVNVEGDQLEGAEFELYASNKTTKIQLVKEADAVYRVATPEEIATEGFKSAVVVAGNVTIKGLDTGTYYLKEIIPPHGYNLLAKEVEVVISATYNGVASTVTLSGEKDNAVAYDNDVVTVTNYTGAELPYTGGMGTVLFIVIGTLMVLSFGVLLVTKMRMAKVAL